MKKFILFLLIFCTLSTPVSAQRMNAQSNICTTVIGTFALPSGIEPGCVSTSSGGPCQNAPTTTFQTATQYTDAIKNKWGITATLPLDQMQYMWEEFHEIDCTGILQDIKGAVIGSWNNNYSQQFSCPSAGGVNLYIGNHHGGDWVKALITHELTHIWQFCSTRGEANRLEIPAAYAAEGGLTNYSRTTCGFGSNTIYEDHADTIALYLNPNTGELTCGNGAPNPFQGGKFPLHRALAARGTGR